MHKTEALRTIRTQYPKLWNEMQTGQISYREAKKRAGLDTPAPRKAVAAHTVTVGTIYRASWGYDQTNIDFYEVTAVTRTMVELRKLKVTRKLGEHWGHEIVEPRPGEYAGEPFRRRVSAEHGNYVSIESFIPAAPWNGSPALATSYA